MNVALGRLSSVPLREVWPHEANDFTPWLAKAENLSLLSETLGIGDLEVQGTEVPVGGFYIDILARDINGDVVVIENQFGSTNHVHLGQILTYLAGQEGRASVIWIAESFREEHRAAIDWLNASTVEGFDFFAVELEVLRIGSSDPAPQFDVVAKPNAWSRGVTRTTRETVNKPLDDRQKAYHDYWMALAEYLNSCRSPIRIRTATPKDYWCGFGQIGQSAFALGATAVFRDRKIGVEIFINHRCAKAAFDRLYDEKKVIESEFGGALEWQRLNDKKGCRIAVFRSDCDPKNKTEWPQQHAWIIENVTKFARVFADRIAALDLDSESAQIEDPAS